MSLLWCDGFDHYGTDTSNMTDGAWAEVGTNGFSISATNPRTGSRSLRYDDTTAFKNLTRRVYGSAKTSIGVGAAFWLSNLPSVADKFKIFDFRDADNIEQVSIVLQTTGIIEVKRGGVITGTTLGDSATPVVVAEAYTHIECFVEFDNTNGSVEVRVDGVTVVNIVGVDTIATSLVESSQLTVGTVTSTSNTTGTTTFYIDDIFCYDDQGSYNNTFIGDRKVATLFPNADTAVADWTVVGTVSGYQAIDEDDPNDDTDYIEAGTPGSPSTSSEFEMGNLPSGVGAISAVVLVNRSRKTDAGQANITASFVSASSTSGGKDRPITTAYTYYHDAIEADPDTGAPFTSTAVDGMKIRLERTA